MNFSRELALKLLQIKAIKINTQNLFKWASGIQSPIYCDNRLALSYPELRDFIKKGFVELSTQHAPFDFVGGVATAGIPWGALLADALDKPFVYVRSASKSHGRKNKIEGEIDSGKTVLLVEDLISTGGSSLNAVKALRENNNEVKAVVSIFNYNLKSAFQNFENANCQFDSLSNYDILLEEAQKINYITEDELNLLKTWKNDPENWYKKL
ncbi:MAG TPA: orotate phosphoribosyltransferase [Saprospiraceae bacterium]|nr:orotate phosphoribosyltransferase [Saprospiraceae bacterium]